MGYRFTKKDLGGTGTEWSVICWINKMHDENYGRIIHLDFKSPDITAAKKILLSYCQKLIKRIKNIKHTIIVLQALPRLEDENGKTYLVGEQMLRLRSQYSNRKILQIKNPDVVFVQGYGPPQ